MTTEQAQQAPMVTPEFMEDFNACIKLLALEGPKLADEKAFAKNALAVLGVEKVHNVYRWLRKTLERQRAHAQGH